MCCDILFRQFPVAGNVLRRILTRDLPDCKHTNPKTDCKSTNQRNITQQNPHLSQDEYSNLWWDVMTNNYRACFDLLPKSCYVLTCNKLFDFCRSRDLNSWSTTNQGYGHQDNNSYENGIYSSYNFLVWSSSCVFWWDLLAWTRHRWLEKSWDCRWRCWEPRDCWLAPSSLQINTFTVFFLFCIWPLTFLLFLFVYIYEYTSQWPKVVFEACWATEVPFLRVKKRPV